MIAKGTCNVLVYFSAQRRVDAMYLHVETNTTRLGIKQCFSRVHVLYTCSRRTYYYRILTSLFRFSKITVNKLSRFVALQFQKIAVHLIRREFADVLHLRIHRAFSLSVESCFPEFLEIFRYLCVWFQFLRRESHFDMMIKCTAFQLYTHLAIAETGIFHCSQCYFGLTAF